MLIFYDVLNQQKSFYAKAAVCYQSAIDLLKDCQKEDKHQNARDQLLVHSLVNLAACYLRLKKLVEVIYYCDEALRIDKTYLKAYFRKAEVILKSGFEPGCVWLTFKKIALQEYC